MKNMQTKIVKQIDPSHWRSIKKILLIISILLCTHCLGLSKDQKSDNSFLALLGLGSSSDLPAPVNESSPPVISGTSPSGPNTSIAQINTDIGGIPASSFKVSESSIASPENVSGQFVPVGKVYEVGLTDEQKQKIVEANPELANAKTLIFPTDPAVLTFSYDKEGLKNSGFTEEFTVYYFDSEANDWKSVERTFTDSANGKVYAITSHFTPFVLTAAPSATGNNVADPPSCIAADFPAGSITSSFSGWTPKFTIVGTQFKYLQDRNYQFVNMSSLGFEGALGIATCNGEFVGAGTCGNISDHKHNTNANYIQFYAHADIDVYILYDTRGGVDQGNGINDNSKDASWLSAKGFVPQPGFFVATTDAVGQFKIYKKKYYQGELVSLDGNRKGAPNPTSVDTNYSVIIKRASMTASEPASALCVAQPDMGIPYPVVNLKAIPGSNSITLVWQNPDDADFAGTVIRRGSISPALIGAGVSPGGSALTDSSYRDTGLTLGQTYCYSVFSLDTNQNQRPPASICATTSADTDGDFVSNIYENTEIYPSTSKTLQNNPDTDGDGVIDGVEIGRGTDPTNSDNSSPAITQFILTSQTPTNNPAVFLNLDATDNSGVTGYYIGKNSARPLASHSGFSVAKPTYYILKNSGLHKLYAWVRDAAGNVSSLYPELDLNLNGINASKFVYVPNSGSNSISIFSINQATGALTLVGTQPTGGNYPNLIEIDQTNEYMYVPHYYSGDVRVFQIDKNTGLLTPFSNLFIGNTLIDFKLHKNGKFAYTSNQSPPSLNIYSVSNGQLSIVQAFPQPGRMPRNIGLDESGYGWYTTEGIITRVFSSYINSNTGYPQGNGSYSEMNSPTNVIAMHPDGQGYILGTDGYPNASDPNNLYSMLGSYGSTSFRSGYSLGSPGNPCKPNDIVISPNGKLIFVPTACNDFRIFEYNFQNGQLSLKRLEASGTDVQGAAIDITGQFLYVASFQNNTIRPYRINESTGTVSTIGGYVPTQTHPRKPAILSIHDANDPPIVIPPADYIAIMGYDAYGYTNFLDPDSKKCHVLPNQYQYSWSVLSVPAGSNITSASLNNANARTPRFRPDRPGLYRLSVTLTDHPGVCPGSAKSTTGTVEIKVGYYKTQTVEGYGNPVSPTDGQAILNPYYNSDSGDIYINNTVINMWWGVSLGYAKRIKYPDWKTRQFGTLRAWHFVPFFTGFIPVLGCESPNLEIPYAEAYCNQIVITAYVPTYNYTHTVPYHKGIWRWISFNP